MFSIKSILLSCASLIIVLPCSAQWTTLGVNTTISGNVGIGTTSPSTALQVVGIATAGTLALTEGTNSLAFLGRGASITSGYAVTPDALALTYNKRDFAIGGWAKTDASWKGVSLFINSDNGYTGIGTTTPSTQLHVAGTTTTNTLLLSEGTNSLAYLGRGASITTGYATTPDVFALTYNKRDFAIGGWAKTGAAWKGVSFYINSDNGYTGIGTTAPSTQLHVAGTTTTNTLLLSEGANSLAYLGRGASITSGLTTTPEVLALTYIKRDFAIGGWAKADGGWQGLSLYINSDNGYTGIGTNSPDQRLTVSGTIHAKEIKVDATIPTPDYVFDSEYKLATLDEVKAYIGHYHHLAGVPSAVQVAKEGILLGEMNQRLLKKVEELTLYMINKDEQVKELQKGIEEQKAYNKSLEYRLLKLESKTYRK